MLYQASLSQELKEVVYNITYIYTHSISMYFSSFSSEEQMSLSLSLEASGLTSAFIEDMVFRMYLDTLKGPTI